MEWQITFIFGFFVGWFGTRIAMIIMRKIKNKKLLAETKSEVVA